MNLWFSFTRAPWTILAARFRLVVAWRFKPRIDLMQGPTPNPGTKRRGTGKSTGCNETVDAG